jgi:uncharacterized protein (TIGR03435 family)
MKNTLLPGLALILPLFAQEAAPPAFDVASVKLADDAPAEGRRIQTTPNSLTTHGLTLRASILWAYGMPAQVIGPDWIDAVRLDIAAKTNKPATDKQLYSMLRTLLVARMGLKTHVEQREIGVYGMTLAKGGPKFQESKTEGPEVIRQEKTFLVVEHASLNELAAELSGKLFDRPVIDATGLKGRYDIRLDMAALRTANQMSPNDPAGAMMSAMEEQLGIKIVPRKAPVEVLIIDHVERKPSDN